MAILLKRGEVEGLIDMRRGIEVLKQAYIDQSGGAADQIPPLRLMRRGMRMAIGGLTARDRRGLRVSVTGGGAVALLFEISSGKLLSVMGYPFGQLRIGATIGIGVECFTPPAAASAAMIGSGRNALWLLEGAKAVRPLKKIFVYSRSAEHREAFARRAAAKLEVDVMAANSPQAALAQAEMVIVSTNSPEPVLRGAWLPPGARVFAAGRPNELDDAVYLKAGLVSVASKTHELGYYDTGLDQPLLRLPREGRLRWESVAEIGDILCGKIAAPRDPDAGIVFRDSQGGYGDVALAARAYEEAVEKGLGQEISLE